MEPQRPGLKPAAAASLSLGRYHISEEYGFLLQNPLKELPDHYRPWMEIANKLPHLIESHQLQAHVYKMPLLDCRFLKGHREQRLAHLVLAAITMGFVWQEGETQPQKVLPRSLAIPFVEVSRNLGLPPILVHSDLVLTNWTKRNPEGPWEISYKGQMQAGNGDRKVPLKTLAIWWTGGPCGNLETIVSFPGGESLRAFILVTVLVEKAAAPGIKALVQGVDAVLQQSQDTLLQALQQVRLSIQDITRTLAQMHDYVDPDIFYTVIRLFLSGWKDNPAMPVGLVYEGVATEPLRYSGGSAAQSSVLQAFDEFLGIQHCKGSVGFLHRMRDYMPPSHKAFLEDLHSAPSLRDHVLTSGAGCCLMAYNQCVEALVELRSYHINVVARYIISAAAKARSRMPSRPSPHAPEDRGTGGTAVLSFLKSVREKTVEAILHPCA